MSVWPFCVGGSSYVAATDCHPQCPDGIALPIKKCLLHCSTYQENVHCIALPSYQENVYCIALPSYQENVYYIH